MVKIYKKKILLLNSLNEKERDSKMFFQFPVTTKGQCNYISFNKDDDLFENINSFSKKDILHELFLDGTMRKPYLDIEHYYSTVKEFKQDSKRILKQLIEDIIKVFSTEYNKKINPEDILLLNSSGEVDNCDNKFKLSVHVIVSPKKITYYYLNSKFGKNNTVYHFYSCLINLNNEYKDYLDGQVYKKDPSLRMIGSVKYSSMDRELKPFDSVSLTKIDISETDKFEYLVSYVDKNKKLCLLETPIINQTIVQRTNIIHNNPSKTNCNDQLLKLVQKYHPSAKLKGISNGFYNFNYTDRKEPCPVTDSLHSGSIDFYCYETSTGFYLKCRSEKCKNNFGLHIGYIGEADEFINDAHQINQQYLLTTDEKNPVVPDLIEEWINNKKTLCIKSAMGTGKTTLIKHILDTRNDFKKILWITHRQTLTKSLYGSFKKYGFVNYLDTEDNLMKENRVIVQVDSLKTRMSFEDYDQDSLECNIVHNKYDLVIIDEVEGCLSHYNSRFLNEGKSSARDIFNLMTDIIKHSNKLLLLDADIDVRTMLFSEHFGRVITINNTYQPIKKNFIITNDDERFDGEFYADIKSGKNVCVVSMSSRSLEEISYKLIEMKIKYVMHISKSDDKLKDKLEDVNSFWKNIKLFFIVQLLLLVLILMKNILIRFIVLLNLVITRVIKEVFYKWLDESDI